MGTKSIPTLGELRERADKLKPYQRKDIDAMTGKAFSFADGWAMGTGKSVDSMAFAMAYMDHAISHHETGAVLLSLRNAFEAFLKSGEIKRP